MPVAIVTGASRGLGLALARSLVQRGWRLIVDARGKEALSEATAGLEGVTPVAGDLAGPSPQPALADYPLPELRRLYEVNVVAPLELVQLALPGMESGAAILNVTSDAAVEAYEGWGGYGSSKAALEQLGAILAAEHPALRLYTVDPGDMRTQMHQEAFPGEDISDRPPPESSVPGLIATANATDHLHEHFMHMGGLMSRGYPRLKEILCAALSP